MDARRGRSRLAATMLAAGLLGSSCTDGAEAPAAGARERPSATTASSTAPPVVRTAVDPRDPRRSVTCPKRLNLSSVRSKAGPPERPYAATPEEALRRNAALFSQRADSFPDDALYSSTSFERLPAAAKRKASVAFVGYRPDGSVFAVVFVRRHSELPHWYPEELTFCS